MSMLMRFLTGLLFSFLIIGCVNSLPQESSVPIPKENPSSEGAENVAEDFLSKESYSTFFVVVADTGMNYDALHAKLEMLNKSTDIGVDSTGCVYNREKDLIALPEDDEDEVYAGEYYPRRYVSAGLSLEYLSWYKKEAKEKTIALLAGIFVTESEADSLLVVLRKQSNKAFKLKSTLYTGCIH